GWAKGVAAGAAGGARGRVGRRRAGGGGARPWPRGAPAALVAPRRRAADGGECGAVSRPGLVELAGAAGGSGGAAALAGGAAAAGAPAAGVHADHGAGDAIGGVAQ